MVSQLPVTAALQQGLGWWTYSLYDNTFDGVLLDFCCHFLCFVLTRKVVDGNVAAFCGKSLTYQSSQASVKRERCLQGPASIQMSVYTRIPRTPGYEDVSALETIWHFVFQTPIQSREVELDA